MDTERFIKSFKIYSWQNNLTSKETNLVVQHHIKCIPEILENLAKKLKIKLPRNFK